MMSSTRHAAIFTVLVFASIGLTAQPSFEFSDGELTIRTARYEVAWRNGCMVGLRTLLPGAASLALAERPMRTDRLPSGLGSFHGHEQEGKEQHHIWGSVPDTSKFPAQHGACESSEVKVLGIEKGVRLTYVGLDGEPDGTLVQEFTVEDGTGDLVIRQRGSSKNPGVFGVAFSLLNLRPDIELIVPYFGGQRWTAEFRRGQILSCAWPEFWNVALVIGEALGGGVFGVWAEDEKMRPKFLYRYHGGDAQAIAFESCNDAPFGSKTACKAFTWRFNTFAESWIEPAQRYKAWMAKAYGMTPRSERGSAWVDDIALVWPTYPSESLMKQMAQTFDPQRTLIMCWGTWPGFNRRIPEYIPRNKSFAEHVAAAHRLGYRCGVYTSMALVDVETHPTMMKDYGLDFFYRGLWRDKPTKPKGWLVYVHPGSAKWREFYANKMAEIVSKYGVDYLYQDVSGCGVCSSGIIDGKTFCAAVVACEDAIRKKLPRVALGGEFWNEVNVCREDFGLMCFIGWGGEDHREFISRPDQPHPIMSYLFSEYCPHWTHRIMVRDTKQFHRNWNIGEVVGSMPVWTTTPDDRGSEARVVLERAKLFAEGFRPHFPMEWGPSVVSYLRGGTGRIVKYVRRGGSTFCYEETGIGDRLRYARVTGVVQVGLAQPVMIDGWPAYGATGPIGLNPAQWYCVFPGKPEDVPVRLAALPNGASIEGTRITDGYCLVQVAGSGAGEIKWQSACRPMSVLACGKAVPVEAASVRAEIPATLLFAFAEPKSVESGTVLPLDEWTHNIVCNGHVVKGAALKQKRTFTFGDVSHFGYMVFPPRGGVGAEYSIDGLVALPGATRLALSVATGLVGKKGDGVHFVVRVNGKEVWRLYRETKPGWQDAVVALDEYAGKTVLLSLAIDCGKSGFNLSCDESVWGDPRIVVGE